MEDSALLEKLKGQRWERVTAAEDNGLRKIIPANRNANKPYMYTDQLTVCVEQEQEEFIINGFSALKKLGLLSTLSIVMRKEKDAEKTHSKELISRISSELGKLRVTKTLKVYFTSMIEGQESILNEISKNSSLERLAVQDLSSPDSCISKIISRAAKCENLKYLCILRNGKMPFDDNLKSATETLSNLVNLENFIYKDSFENLEFYESLGYQLSKLPNLKRVSISQGQVLNYSRRSPEEQLQYQGSIKSTIVEGIYKLVFHLKNSPSLEEVVLDTLLVGDEEDKFNLTFDALSSIKSLKCFRFIIDRCSSNIFQKLRQFTQLKELTIQIDEFNHTNVFDGVEYLTQLKKIDFNCMTELPNQVIKAIAKKMKPLKELTYLTLPDTLINPNDYKRYLPSLVVCTFSENFRAMDFVIN